MRISHGDIVTINTLVDEEGLYWLEVNVEGKSDRPTAGPFPSKDAATAARSEFVKMIEGVVIPDTRLQ